MSFPGTYEESLPCGGKLKVTKSSWLIEYYFSGPDMRYNGDFVRVQSSQVDSYITAFNDNWDKYCEMKKTIPKDGEFNTSGKSGMQIRIGGFHDGVCITSYHMPLNSISSINKVISSYKYAKQRAPKIKQFLAALK